MMVPNVSQEDLGAAFGITFQQIQKYEKGVKRLSAAMMVQIAAVLKVDVQYFFDELPTGAKNTKEIKTPILINMSLASHGPRPIDAFLKLKSDKLRGAVTDLVHALARAG
jgi:transcriptional regulator with XRE-family HTH domain